MSVDEILAAWTSNGGRLNRGASPELLQLLEGCLDCALPRLLRDLYAAANGMEDGTLDSHGVNFWPIEKIVQKTYVIETAPTAGIAFADVLLDSWLFLYRRRDDGRLDVVNESTSRAHSPEEFWRIYLTRPRALDL